MGHVRVAIRIAHAYRREKFAEVPGALIDTGVTTLETLGFAVDPKNHRLGDAELVLL